jgi:hypothetical protein
MAESTIPDSASEKTTTKGPYGGLILGYGEVMRLLDSLCELQESKATKARLLGEVGRIYHELERKARKDSLTDPENSLKADPRAYIPAIGEYVAEIAANISNEADLLYQANDRREFGEGNKIAQGVALLLEQQSEKLEKIAATLKGGVE